MVVSRSIWQEWGASVFANPPAPPSKSVSLRVPTKLEDFEKLLDNYRFINVSGKLGEISSDNLYIENEQTWAALYTPDERNAYIWAPDLFEGTGNINDWVFSCRQILYANIVLEGLAKITPATQTDHDQIKGWALFVRGHALFNLAQHFAPAYDPQTASALLGLPIRLFFGFLVSWVYFLHSIF